MKRNASIVSQRVCHLLTICVATLLIPHASADSPNELEKKARGALSRLYRHNKIAAENIDRAYAVLVFPEARKLALGVGLETATGILFERMKPLSFYNLTAFSCGLELGIEKFGYAIFFMDEGALDYLYNSRGLEIGGSPSLVVADSILAGSFGTTAEKNGILTFRFNQTGLMLDIGIHLAKFTEYEPSE
jgi:lipid-binding SYLF domain-containing protein